MVTRSSAAAAQQSRNGTRVKLPKAVSQAVQSIFAAPDGRIRTRKSTNLSRGAPSVRNRANTVSSSRSKANTLTPVSMLPRQQVDRTSRGSRQQLVPASLGTAGSVSSHWRGNADRQSEIQQFAPVPSFVPLNHRRKTNLSAQEKFAIMTDLLALMMPMEEFGEGDALEGAGNFGRTRSDKKQERLHDAFNFVAADYEVAAITVANVWNDYWDHKERGEAADFEPKPRSGRPSKLTPVKRQAIVNSSQKRKYRTTARIVARDAEVDSHVIIPITSVWRYRKKMGYKKHNEYTKTKLSLTNKIKRLAWAIDEVERIVDQQSGLVTYRLKDLSKRAFFDEKVFKLQTKAIIYKRDCDPDLPSPALRDKLHPAQVMISAGFAFPQVKTNGEFFSGCLGIHSFVERVPAKRSSAYRAAGTLETKPVSVTAPVYLDSMTRPGGLMDQIQQESAGLDLDCIIINLDSATPHTGNNNIAVLNQRGSVMDIPIVFRLQPPQSPDLNLLDLCIWYSLAKQSEYVVGDHRNVDDIIANVTSAYNDYSVDKLLRMYALYYVVIRKVLITHGNNDFKIPHTGIRKRQLNVMLPTEDRTVDSNVYEDAVAALVQMRETARVVAAELVRKKHEAILVRRQAHAIV